MTNFTKLTVGNTNKSIVNFFSTVKFLVIIFLVFGLFGINESLGQNISTYTFAQSNTTFTSISSTTGVVTVAASDDAVHLGQPIGFTFTYHGTVQVCNAPV